MRLGKPFGLTLLLMLFGGSLFVLSGCGGKSEQAAKRVSDEAIDSSAELPDPTPDWTGPDPVLPDAGPAGAAAAPPPDAVISPRMADPGPVLVGPQNLVRPGARSQPISVDTAISLPRPQPIPAAADVPLAAAASRDDASASGDLADEAVAEQRDGYEVVTVFYGTDRKAVGGADSDRGGLFDGWFYLTAVCAGIALILTIITLRFSRRRPVVALTGISYTATFVLAVVTVVGHFDRARGASEPGRTYGNDRGVLEMGTCPVSIPKDHEVGEVERPSIFRLEFHEDPTRHVVLMNVERQAEDEFYAALKDRVGRSARKEAFVFIHGFNVTFEAAARRTAQLAYDLQFDGAPVFYSWPSQGGLLKYAVDETNVVWTVPHLKEFLTGIARRSGAEAVHLIAHSMGNRALTAALGSLASELPDEHPMFREVLLTAPDIDADVFRTQIAPAIVKTARRVTLYASSNDEALAMSKRVHGSPRAGDSGSGLVIVPDIDTIDVSTVDTSLIGHSYYGSNDSVIADMIDLLRDASPPDRRRWLRPMRLGQMLYWVFSPDPARVGALPPPQPTTR